MSRTWEGAGHGAAAELVDALAEGVAGAGMQIGTVDAFGAEEQIGDAAKRRGAVDGEGVTGAGALVPAGHDEVAEVGHVVEVVVGEEELIDGPRINGGGEELHCGAGAEVEDCAGVVGQDGNGLAGAVGAGGWIAGADEDEAEVGAHGRPLCRPGTGAPKTLTPGSSPGQALALSLPGRGNKTASPLRTKGDLQRSPWIG